jgi:cyclophilin family peptidyl-prolyl cis-trans isomerase
MHKEVGLPHSYTIFGKVTDGIDVVDSIAESKTDRSDRPESEVQISSVEVAES